MCFVFCQTTREYKIFFCLYSKNFFISSTIEPRVINIILSFTVKFTANQVRHMPMNAILPLMLQALSALSCIPSNWLSLSYLRVYFSPTVFTLIISAYKNMASFWGNCIFTPNVFKTQVLWAFGWVSQINTAFPLAAPLLPNHQFFTQWF